LETACLPQYVLVAGEHSLEHSPVQRTVWIRLRRNQHNSSFHANFDDLGRRRVVGDTGGGMGIHAPEGGFGISWMVIPFVFLALIAGTAAALSVENIFLSVETSLRQLAGAAAATLQEKCAPNSTVCDSCSLNACSATSPASATCFTSGFGTPNVCSVQGQVKLNPWPFVCQY